LAKYCEKVRASTRVSRRGLSTRKAKRSGEVRSMDRVVVEVEMGMAPGLETMAEGMSNRVTIES
jgi:hypothetical protein